MFSAFIICTHTILNFFVIQINHGSYSKSMNDNYINVFRPGFVGAFNICTKNVCKGNMADKSVVYLLFHVIYTDHITNK